MDGTTLNSTFLLVIFMAALGLAPFAAMMVTSYIKIVVVVSIIRQALGIQQIPPNMVINGMAIVLSLYVMAPVGDDMLQIARSKAISLEKLDSFLEEADGVQEPLRGFLLKHSDTRERAFFLKSAGQLWPAEKAELLSEDDFMVLVPAFMVTELTKAFQISFLIYLPFIVIDLVVANILMAMGMMMMSPTTVSLPFKLLLFVLINGWERLVHGLVLTYA